MHPSGYQKRYMLYLWYIMPRSKGGVFVEIHFPEKIRAELTKVNKLHVNYLKSVYCERRILLLIKLLLQLVNKFHLFLRLFQ